MPNIPRPVLRRRRLLQSGGIVALGAITTTLAGRRLFSAPPSRAQLAGPPEPAEIPDLTKPASELEDISSIDPPAPSPASRPGQEPEPLTHEEEYAQFIASLELRHLNPAEIIHPHRGVYGGVPNQLPPKTLWKKIAPTLQVADELRERLGVPLLRITSAYRCPRYNRQIPGAASRSYHVRNQALDLIFACSSRDAAHMVRKLRNERFFRGGLGIYPSFIHVDTRGYNANWNG